MISVIIPTFNEAQTIGKTIQRLCSNIVAGTIEEIIVVDGGSTDRTIEEAIALGAVAIVSARKGRAAQMNEGARQAKGKILYFLHADSIPPKQFEVDIINAVNAGYPVGCFQLQFDYDHWFLKAHAWFTRFDINAFRFGDQSLFVSQDIFKLAGGFREDHIVMEDQEIIKRLKRHGKFKVLPGSVTTSSRKYLANGVIKMQSIFYLIYFMYQLGFKQQTLVNTYRTLIKQDKV